MASAKRTEAPEEWFFYLMFQTVRRRELAFAGALEALGLNLPKWRALSVISRLSGCTMNELAEFTTIDRTTLTRTADQLIEADLVARCGLPGDRRIVRLEMTERGEGVFQKALGEMRGFNRQALEGVSAADQDHLRATLRTVLANITGSADRADAIVDMRRGQG
ncbi:MAG: MarR family winged helix-turn-helix transcriptional regulator [Phenylobacterium sp.]